MKRRKKRNNLELTKFITKLSLVIYFSLVFIFLFILLGICKTSNEWSYMWGFLLCLGPSLVFMLVSMVLPLENIPLNNSKKKTVVVRSILYAVKYLLVICIPLIGVYYNTQFNAWTMLAITLLAPVLVITIKVVLAIKIDRKSKTDTKNAQNTIKF